MHNISSENPIESLTVVHPPKNVHFANIVWWKAGAYASDNGSLAPWDIGLDKPVIEHSRFEGDNHGIHAHNMTFGKTQRKKKIENEHYQSLYQTIIGIAVDACLWYSKYIKSNRFFAICK